MKKNNKIIVAVSPDRALRQSMIRRLAVDMGFAKTPGDAGKIIRQSPYDYDLANCYFLFAETYNLQESILTTGRLYELAATGIAVVVGVRKIPPAMEFICEAFFPHNFTRL
ncbi:MAG: hypothetical protein LBQ39_07005 [Tannerellaceae bacterium]|jgi:hypothetical protein|nr:hypothetical protein [Tannerellaceae bacterium]